MCVFPKLLQSRQNALAGFLVTSLSQMPPRAHYSRLFLRSICTSTWGHRVFLGTSTDSQKHNCQGCRRQSRENISCFLVPQTKILQSSNWRVPLSNAPYIHSMKTPNCCQEVTVGGESGEINMEYLSRCKLRHLTCWFHRPREGLRLLLSVHKYLGPVPRKRNSQVPTLIQFIPLTMEEPKPPNQWGKTKTTTQLQQQPSQRPLQTPSAVQIKLYMVWLFLFL